MSDPNNTLPAVEPEQQFSIEDDVQTSNTKSYSQGQLVRRRFFRHKGAMVSMVVLIFIILLAVTSLGWGPIPGWWGKTYTDTYLPLVNGGRPTIQLFPPSLGEHPFGQDTVGKDHSHKVGTDIFYIGNSYIFTFGTITTVGRTNCIYSMAWCVHSCHHTSTARC